jgi:MinD-like ATPase involved in chromosome partitioning or flagellar assembly
MLRVLTGIPLPSRWPELRPAGVQAVLAAARALADFTIVDCGFNLETDEELSYDTMAPRRYGATLAVLESADIVIVVGGADPIGMQRLVRALGELDQLDLNSRVQVVLNRVRNTVLRGDPSSELTATLDRFAGAAVSALLPYERDSLDAALATGQTLAEHKPTSPLRTAIHELAANLAGVPAHRRRRHS